jgi:hypothetical protein
MVVLESLYPTLAAGTCIMFADQKSAGGKDGAPPFWGVHKEPRELHFANYSAAAFVGATGVGSSIPAHSSELNSSL